MPTKKKPPKTKKTSIPIKKVSIPSSIWKFTKNNPALVFLMAFIVVGLIFGSIYLFERWQFSSAEKKLDTVASAIVADLGEPASIQKSKTCSYQSTVFEDQRGLPSCGVSYLLTYGYRDSASANSIRKAIYSLLLNNGYNLKNSTITNYDSNPSTYEYPDEYATDSVAFLNCSANVENYSNKQIKIYFGCSNSNTFIKIFSSD